MGLTVNRMSSALGAEVIGADLTRPLDDATFGAIRQALLDHQMIAIRDQALAPDQQIAFSARFGRLEYPDNVRYRKHGHPQMMVLSNDRDADGNPIGVPDAGDAWHSDLSFKPEPALCTLLHAIKLPSEGGDTEFANQYAAYEALPRATKHRLEGLRAIHTINKLRNPRITISTERPNAQAFYASQGAEHPDTAHPLVRTHPETKRKLLYVSPRFTIGIADIDEDQGQALLDELFDHQLRREFIYRHTWLPGDLVIWDNRCVNHLACGGYTYPDIRLMHRTTVLGDKPY